MRTVMEERARAIVMGVVGEVLRRSGANGAVVGGRGPEGELLNRWITESAIPLQAPSEEAVALVQASLPANSSGAGRPGGSRSLVSYSLAARALAAQDDLLLLGTATKTTILLSPGLHLEPVLPLGDLFATEILAIQGGCSLPTCLEGVAEGVLQTVDDALQRYLEGDMRIDDAFFRVDQPLRSLLEETLRRVQGWWIARPLVPQFRSCTCGIDLDL
ncbi:MAG: hypothetical protein ACQET1_06530 [Gemmatimonadota bacterium]